MLGELDVANPAVLRLIQTGYFLVVRLDVISRVMHRALIASILELSVVIGGFRGWLHGTLRGNQAAILVGVVDLLTVLGHDSR